MSGTKKTFTLIGEEEAPPPPPPPQPTPFTVANAQILLVSLRALSQRTAMELARLANNLFTAGLVVAVWMLVSRTLPNPEPLQLIELAGFAVFCLLADLVRRKGIVSRARSPDRPG
jgi:hypothetical protein